MRLIMQELLYQFTGTLARGRSWEANCYEGWWLLLRCCGRRALAAAQTRAHRHPMPFSGTEAQNGDNQDGFNLILRHSVTLSVDGIETLFADTEGKPMGARQSKAVRKSTADLLWASVSRLNACNRALCPGSKIPSPLLVIVAAWAHHNQNTSEYMVRYTQTAQLVDPMVNYAIERDPRGSYRTSDYEGVRRRFLRHLLHGVGRSCRNCTRRSARRILGLACHATKDADVAVFLPAPTG
jgi:hypothetical protein